jgi:hypothetical protein
MLTGLQRLDSPDYRAPRPVEYRLQPTIDSRESHEICNEGHGVDRFGCFADYHSRSGDYASAPSSQGLKHFPSMRYFYHPDYQDYL